MAKQSVDRSDVNNWVGWVYFAGLMMVLLGIFQAIAGVVALFKDTVYAVGPANIWVLDITTWGWIHLALGLFIASAGMAVLSGKMWGRVVGVVMASMAAIANFAFIPVYPIWGILMVVVCGLVLFALIAHGADAKDELE
jgi:hypothetical protein